MNPNDLNLSESRRGYFFCFHIISLCPTRDASIMIQSALNRIRAFRIIKHIDVLWICIRVYSGFVNILKITDVSCHPLFFHRSRYPLPALPLAGGEDRVIRPLVCSYLDRLHQGNIISRRYIQLSASIRHIERSKPAKHRLNLVEYIASA